jgi:hypothetical protein
MRDLYELGDLDRSEYLARRDAIRTELDALAPEPVPDVGQARKVLEDFGLLWKTETDPEARRQFLSLIFEHVWLDQDRVVAVQPKQAFAAFFRDRRRCEPGRRRGPGKSAGVKYGSDGTRTRDCHPGD